jgi:SAM-dependent methyltransferase
MTRTTPSRADGSISAHNIRQYSSGLIARLYDRGDPYLQPPELTALSLIGDDQRRGAVLDLGVGGARTTPFLAPLASRYLGLDASPAMVRRARVRAPGADIRLGDARHMPEIADGVFDLVLFSNNGIDCLSWDDRLSALAEIRRVLKPGGWFVFASHNRRALPIPRPWDLRPLARAWSAANLLRRLALYPAGIANYVRLRGRERHHVDHAVVHDAGEGLYNLFQIYVDVEVQLTQLDAAGFETSHVIDLEGKVLPPGPPRLASTSLWLTYAARTGAA